MFARLTCLFVFAACSTQSPTWSPDPGGETTGVPANPAGSFRVASTFDLAAPPSLAQPVLATLQAASADPARYLVDRMIDALPEGSLRTLATELEPLVAAYVDHELANIAPRLAPDLVAAASGLERYAHHFGTTELWRVELSGATARTVSALRFDELEVTFEETGQADEFVMTTTTLDGTGALAIAQHDLPLAYGGLLRIALDRVVIPGIDPGATDLARALGDLVDCQQLGAAAATTVGIGSASFYAAACDAALARAASDLYGHLAAIDASPVTLAVAGQAHGLDRDGDGAMDAIEDGAWTGSINTAGSPAPLGAGAFTGAK